MTAPAFKIVEKEIETPRLPVTGLVRACAVKAIAALDGSSPLKVLQSSWPRDNFADLIIRAPVSPTDLSSPLVRAIMPAFLATLAPASAAAKLFTSGLRLSFDGAAEINVPTIIANPSVAAFAASAAPRPVAQLFIEPLITLTPHNLDAIVVLTNEMLRSSNVEAFMRDALIRASALALDQAFFDVNPSSNSRPAGVRNGIAALTASPAPDALAALISDIETLNGAVVAVTPMHPVFIMSIKRLLTAQLLSPHGLAPLQTFGTFALANSTDMIALSSDAVVSVAGTLPEISLMKDATLHMAAPALELVDSPGIVAAPSRSLYQSDCTAIRVRLPVSWGLRTPQGVAYLAATHW
jgi:hypothetical protein